MRASASAPTFVNSPRATPPVVVVVDTSAALEELVERVEDKMAALEVLAAGVAAAEVLCAAEALAEALAAAAVEVAAAEAAAEPLSTPSNASTTATASSQTESVDPVADTHPPSPPAAGPDAVAEAPEAAAAPEADKSAEEVALVAAFTSHLVAKVREAASAKGGSIAVGDALLEVARTELTPLLEAVLREALHAAGAPSDVTLAMSIVGVVASAAKAKSRGCIAWLRGLFTRRASASATSA